jgi:hypothetical protein
MITLSARVWAAREGIVCIGMHFEFKRYGVYRFKHFGYRPI